MHDPNAPLQPQTWQSDPRSASFGSVLHTQWEPPLLSRLPDGPLGDNPRVVLQDQEMEDQGIAWELRRGEKGWTYIGGGAWSTHSASSTVMNEASLSSAISVDRMSALDRYTVPYTGRYMASYQLTTYQDTSGSWIAGHIALADVDAETAILTDTISSAGSTHDVRVNVARTAAVDLDAGQEIGLFMYRDTQIWSIRSYGWQIHPLRLDFA